MKSLLYLGNKLTGIGLNATTIDTLSHHLQREGFVVKTSSSQQNKTLRLLDMLWSVVQHRNVDFVLIDTYSTSAFWFAFLISQLCRALKIPYIPILHGGNLPYRIKKNPKLSQLIFENAYQNVAPSHYLKKELELAGFHNILHIPNTIEIQNYPFKKRATLKPKLLWVRAFASIYNPSMAIDVFQAIKKVYPDATLCMVGPDKDGSLVSTQKYAQTLGLDVCFTGQLPKSEWIRLAADCDIFLNTTHFDNTPVSVMEAMALGLPVVTTNVGGISYLLADKEDALLVGDGDVMAMVNAIVQLLEHPSNSLAQIEAAREKVAGFDWEVGKMQWIALLR